MSSDNPHEAERDKLRRNQALERLTTELERIKTARARDDQRRKAGKKAPNERRGRHAPLYQRRRHETTPAGRRAPARGLTYPAIAERLGWRSHASAHAAVQAGLRDDVREPAAQLVQLKCARLDAMQQAIWPAAMRGNLGAIDRVVSLMARRAKLLGLDRPTTLDVTHVDADLDMGIDRLLA